MNNQDVNQVILLLFYKKKKHDTFKRVGNDLYIEMKLSLVEALCGFSVAVKHLDGRTLLVKSKSGQVVQHGELRNIAGEGMPTYKHPFDKGTLYIQFLVELPLSLTPKQVDDLQAILIRDRPLEEETEHTEHVNLSDPISPQEHQQQRQQANAQARRGEAYDDEEGGEEGHGHGSRVNCSQS